MGTLLSIVQSMTQRVGIPTPSVIASNTDPGVQQLQALVNEVGQELVKKYEWRQLMEPDYTFSTVASQESYPLPADFDRLTSTTQWDRTSRWPGIGPVSPQVWAWLKGQLISGVPRFRFRTVGNNFLVFPTPEAVYTYAFEYIRNTWATDTTGVTYKSAVTADSDIILFDDLLMARGLRLKWQQAKGLDWEAAAADYMLRLDECMAQDQGSPVLSLGQRPTSWLIGPQSVPDGSWPV